MPGTTIVQMRNKGSLTLPVNLRRKYRLAEGDLFTLIDLEDGAFLLMPKQLQVERLGERVAQILEEEGVTQEQLLAALDEERKRYYAERYVRD